MSKLFLSNSRRETESIKKSSIEAGFKKFNEIYSENIALIVFKKLKIENDNFKKFDNNDFIATSGTIIYREKIGANALENIYNDFNCKINKLRKSIIGNYLLVIKKNGHICIFCDKNNIFNLFYYKDSNSWCISNSLFDIAKAVSNKITTNEFNLIESTFQSSIIGNGTIFNEIKRLMGNECIRINLREKNFEINKESYEKISIDFDNIDSLVTKFTQTLNAKVKVISNVFDNITICMTGGLDSRTILASFLKNNVKPDLVYGVGNSPLTNTKDRDLEIVKLLANRYDLNLYIMNWGTPEKVDQHWEKYLNKYGFLFRIYNASNNLFSEYEDNIHTGFIEFGYFGETLRNRPWLETISEDYFTLGQFVYDFYINKELTYMYSKYEQYKESLIKKFQDISKKYGIDDQRISKDDFLLFYNHWFKGGAHNEKCNFVNYLFHSISIMSTYDINRIALNIPYENKKDAKFMLKSLYAIFPDILNAPIFSHGTNQIFDKNEFRLIEENKDYKIISYVKHILKVIEKNERLLNFLKSVYFFKKNNYSSKELDEINKKKKIKKVLVKMIKENEYNIINNLEHFKGYLPLLAWYAQELFIVKKIFKFLK